MIKNVLTHIGGVGLYGVVSMLIFIAVFVGVGIWMLCLNRSYYASMEVLPLEDEDGRQGGTGSGDGRRVDAGRNGRCE